MKYSHRGIERLGELLEDISKKIVAPKETLPLPNSTLERAIQRTESIARRLFLLPQLPSSTTMATVTTSIGTTGRDYSTITSWEADLDNSGIYSAADDAVGECYNDSVFDEAFTMNGGGTLGLNSVTLSVAAGERHDGTAGSGARIDRSTANGTVVTLAVPTTIEWLEIDRNSNPDSGTSQGILVDVDGCTVRNMILHGIRSTDGLCFGIVDSNEDFDAMNNIIYNLLNEATGSAKCGGITDGGGSVRTYRWLNNTVYNVVNNGGSGACYGFDFVGGTLDVRNNIAIGTTGTTTGAKADFLGTSGASIDYNCDSDGSATGANSITSSAANLFVSIVGGSEDLHLKSGADAIDAGTDLGTTPSGVNIDINGYDRDAGGVTWDIGAHEYVAAGSTYTLIASAGTLLLSGLSTSLLLSRKLTATIGSFALTGNTTLLLANKALLCSATAFSLTGVNADLTYTRRIPCSPGIFTVTGNDTTLTYNSGATYTLSAASGTFVVTGFTTSLLLQRYLTAGVGSFPLQGYSTSLLRSHLLTAASGGFTSTDYPASLQTTRKVTLEQAAYLLTGYTAAFNYSGSNQLTCVKIKNITGKTSTVVASSSKSKATAIATVP